MKFHHSAIVTIIGLGLVSFTGCVATQPIEDGNQAIVYNSKGVPNYYRVKSGDTVSKIAQRYHLSIKQIARLNNLNNRYQINAGQKLRLWKGKGGYYKPRLPEAVPVPVQQVTRPPALKQAPQVIQAKPTFASNANRGYGYMYPSKNRIIQNYQQGSSDGVWFSGRKGDPVYASNAGQVIYAGNQVADYGNLVLIRHSKEITTAYAHNSKLLVREGQYVKRGQQIATMGSTGNSKGVSLEFQVRRRSVAVNPKNYIK
ncbi:MAG: peptidoglycan DD-metalloendopeptidase family protein [Moraxellaceae bacterium]|nr:peptidoglycan DD-metalloendopeptidase family protein [Moraxellaceae bacterium]